MEPVSNNVRGGPQRERATASPIDRGALQRAFQMKYADSNCLEAVREIAAENSKVRRISELLRVPPELLYLMKSAL